MAPNGKSTFVRIVIFLVSMFISAMSASSIYDDYTLSDSTKKYCGPNLTNMLKDLCNNEYESYTVHASKRSEWDVTYDEYLQSFNDQQSQTMDELPFAYQRYAYLGRLAPKTALGPRVRRQWIITRGIVDQCCRKPCSVQEMLNYCKKKTI